MTKEKFLNLLPELVKNYKPAPEVISHINRVSLLIVIGPSGVGKTSLINRLGLQNVLGDTTRDSRPEEENGVDYCFRKDYEKIIDELKKGQFIQVAIGSGGDFYATRINSFPKSGTGVMAVVADVVPVFRNLGFKETISIFISPPSYEVWMDRLSDHKFDGGQKQKRLAEAKRSFEFALSDSDTHFVLNDDLNSAVDQINGIVDGAIDVDREQKAKDSARRILNAIE